MYRRAYRENRTGANIDPRAELKVQDCLSPPSPAVAALSTCSVVSKDSLVGSPFLPLGDAGSRSARAATRIPVHLFGRKQSELWRRINVGLRLMHSSAGGRNGVGDFEPRLNARDQPFSVNHFKCSVAVNVTDDIQQ